MVIALQKAISVYYNKYQFKYTKYVINTYQKQFFVIANVGTHNKNKKVLLVIQSKKNFFYCGLRLDLTLPIILEKIDRVEYDGYGNITFNNAA